MAEETIVRSAETPSIRTKSLLEFIKGIYNDEALNSSDPDVLLVNEEKTTYYLGLGRSEQWSTLETTPFFRPPFPLVSDQAVQQVRDDILVYVKIPKDNVIPVVPRLDWGDPNRGNAALNFKVGDIVSVNTIEGINTFSGADEGIMVYECVGQPEIGTCNITSITDRDECINSGGIWTSESTTVSGEFIPKLKQSSFETGDGYKWNYLYTIPISYNMTGVTEEYLIVPKPSLLETEEGRAEWGLENVAYNNDPDRLIYQLKCDTLIFNVLVSDVDFENSQLLYTNGFRQLSLMADLRESSETPPGPKARNVKYEPNEIDSEIGVVMQIENRPPIVKELDQTELIQIIFSFKGE